MTKTPKQPTVTQATVTQSTVTQSTATQSTATQSRSRLILLALSLTIGTSGCSQSSQWLAANRTEDPVTEAPATVTTAAVTTAAVTTAAVAQTSENNHHAGSLEFDLTQDAATTEQPNLRLTNFTKVIATADTAPSADSSVQILAPPSNHNRSMAPASASQEKYQLTQLATTRQTLTTLAKGESLDSKLKNAPGIVIVDFYADWCGPCRRQGTILHSMKAQAANRQATIIKVNIEQHPELAQKYKVSSLPTLLAVKDGNVVRRQIGLTNESEIASLMHL